MYAADDCQSVLAYFLWAVVWACGVGVPGVYMTGPFLLPLSSSLQFNSTLPFDNSTSTFPLSLAISLFISTHSHCTHSRHLSLPFLSTLYAFTLLRSPHPIYRTRHRATHTSHVPHFSSTQSHTFTQSTKPIVHRLSTLLGLIRQIQLLTLFGFSCISTFGAQWQ